MQTSVAPPAGQTVPTTSNDPQLVPVNPFQWLFVLPFPVEGESGAAGPQGPVGPQGTSGQMGAMGLPGAAGPVGMPGSPGVQGPAGPQGAMGLPGTTDHGALTGLGDDDHPQYVMGGEVDSVTTAMIVDGAVTMSKIADDAVITVNILDGAVTSAKITSVAPGKVSPQGSGSGLDADTVDGVEASALEESAEIDADIATHAGNASAHHARYTDAEAIVAVQNAAQGFLVGEVRMWAGPLSAVPTGWVVCDGSDVARGGTTAALFAVIGTIYGVGDGSTTFTLPDFRDRTPMGASQDDVGVPKTTVEGPHTQIGGAATHTLTANEMPVHDHDISHTHDVTSVSGVGLAGPNIGLGSIGTVQTSGASPSISGTAGGGNAHPILDPYFAIHYIIYAGS